MSANPSRTFIDSDTVVHQDSNHSRLPVDEEKMPSSFDLRSVTERRYLGRGTHEDPYVVDWDLNDPEDPYNWASTKKWIITGQVRFPSDPPHCFTLSDRCLDICPLAGVVYVHGVV